MTSTLPSPIPVTSAAEHDPSGRYNPSDAECLFAAAELLTPALEAGKTIDVKLLRHVMQDAFGASDTEGD